jgi:L-glutamine-phosphate cytidylyltransferase
LKFTPVAWNAVRDLLDELDPHARDRLDVTGLLRQLLARGFPVATLATEGNWGEVDSPSDLALYERMSKAGELALDL